MNIFRCLPMACLLIPSLLIAEGAMHIEASRGESSVSSVSSGESATGNSRQKEAASQSPEAADQPATGQAGAAGKTQAAKPAPERQLPKNFLLDQKDFWTSPLRLRERQLSWFIPLAGATAVTMASDVKIDQQMPSHPSAISHSRTFSNAGVAALFGTAGSFYVFGRLKGDALARETGILAGEAALNSFISTKAIQYMTGRQRPQHGNGKGEFWKGGDSFPSAHAAAAWSTATVIAHEYPGWLTKLLVYGTASAVSLSRMTAREHFASDVLVGSALGYVSGLQAYSRAHPEGNGAGGLFGAVARVKNPRHASDMGSPYVSLDSWIYPAFSRLIALGYVQSASLGLRPWTRMECARLLGEAQRNLKDENYPAQPQKIFETLAGEFHNELEKLDGGSNLTAQIESVYARFTPIAGTPLADGFHFGQTLYNDYGRPYQEGLNTVEGASAWAAAGPIVAYVRGEYQHSPGTPAQPDAVRQAIARIDNLPTQPATPTAEINRFRLLDAYAGVNFKNWMLSFGTQSLWYGPNEGTALAFTNNAEPLPMLRLNRVSPFVLPSIGRWFGAIRMEFFLGQLHNQNFCVLFPETTGQPGDVFILHGNWYSPLDPQPYIHGEKLTLKMTPNFEIGVGLTAVFGGPKVPLTMRNYLRTYKNFSTATYSNGDRRTSFLLSYRLPKLRDWLTFYLDSMAEDEPNPVAYPYNSAMNPGIHLARAPHLNKLELRLEGVYTDIPDDARVGWYFLDLKYPNGYRNNGNIMASWIGRQGKGIQVKSTYWVSPKNSLQTGYRHMQASAEFVPGGGRLDDYSAKCEWWIKPRWSISSFVQVENWLFPLLNAKAQTNVAAGFQVTLSKPWKKGR